MSGGSTDTKEKEEAMKTPPNHIYHYIGHPLSSRKTAIAWPDPFPICPDCGIRLKWEWRTNLLQEYSQGRWICCACESVLKRPTPILNWVPLSKKEEKAWQKKQKKREEEALEAGHRWRALQEEQQEIRKQRKKQKEIERKAIESWKAEEGTCLKCFKTILINRDYEHVNSRYNHKSFCSKQCEELAGCALKYKTEEKEKEEKEPVWAGKYGCDPVKRERLKQLLHDGDHQWNGELSEFP